MRLRYTLILALLLIGLGAYLYFVESKRIGEEAKKDKLVSVSADEVTGIALNYPNRFEATLELRDGRWHLTKPMDALADPTTVSGVLKSLTEAELTKTLDNPPQDLAPFGLAPPMATITLTAKDKQVPPLKVGKTTAVSSSTYVQRGDDPKIYLTSANFHREVDKKLNDFRDKLIVAFDEADVSTLTLSGPGGNIELVKHKDGWMIEKPRELQADDVTVRNLISTIRNMRADDFASDSTLPADLAQLGLERPLREIALRSGPDSKETRLLFGDEVENGMYLKVADKPTTYIIGQWAARELGKSLGELREKTVLAFAPSSVGRVDVRRADGESFALVQTADGWSVENADGPSQADKIKTFVGALSELKGSRVLADASEGVEPFGLSAPAMEITVTGSDGAKIGATKVAVKPSEAGAARYTALRETDGAIIELRDYHYKQLDHKRADFVQAAVPAAPGAPAPAAAGVPPAPAAPAANAPAPTTAAPAPAAH
ncbi:MAG: DUF4340 domain-containing protein [Candidatus Binatia bacterium]